MDTERKGYGKLSAVWKIRVVLSVALIPLFATSDRDVSGPESVNGEDTLSVKV